VRVPVERHRRLRVPGPLGDLPGRDTAQVPQADPPMAKVVRVVVRDSRGLPRAVHCDRRFRIFETPRWLFGRDAHAKAWNKKGSDELVA
jgi:hypothetical protein